MQKATKEDRLAWSRCAPWAAELARQARKDEAKARYLDCHRLAARYAASAEKMEAVAADARRRLADNGPART